MASVYDRVMAALAKGRAVTPELIGTNDQTIIKAWQDWNGKGIPPMVNEPNQLEADADQAEELRRFLLS